MKDTKDGNCYIVVSHGIYIIEMIDNLMKNYGCNNIEVDFDNVRIPNGCITQFVIAMNEDKLQSVECVSIFSDDHLDSDIKDSRRSELKTATIRK